MINDSCTKPSGFSVEEWAGLEISQNCSSLTFKENSFNDLLYCRKPNKKDLLRNALRLNHMMHVDFPKHETTTMQLILIRTFEYLFCNHCKFIWADIEALQNSNLIEVNIIYIGKSCSIVESERNLEINIAEDTEIPIEIIGNSIQPSVVEVSDYNDSSDENENTDALVPDYLIRHANKC